MKTCRVCEVEKPDDDFATDRSRRDGKDRCCRPCKSTLAREWEAANPVAFARQKRRAQVAKYGLTLEDYEAMRDAQGDVCAICGEPETAVRNGVVWELSVDHNHETGAVRALLCSRCNTAIGQMNDSPQTLRAAADYLERF